MARRNFLTEIHTGVNRGNIPWVSAPLQAGRADRLGRPIGWSITALFHDGPGRVVLNRLTTNVSANGRARVRKYRPGTLDVLTIRSSGRAQTGRTAWSRYLTPAGIPERNPLWNFPHPEVRVDGWQFDADEYLAKLEGARANKSALPLFDWLRETVPAVEQFVDNPGWLPAEVGGIKDAIRGARFVSPG